mmetsp:Transcript_6751/g.18838  ORF Transcript_6751/g.18838 Transcript_6751/m.18838 type:complete len:985 (+) Transcript_6751:168-3122(+)
MATANNKKVLAGNKTANGAAARSTSSNGQHGNSATTANGSPGKANGGAGGSTATSTMNGVAAKSSVPPSNPIVLSLFLRMLRTALIDAPLAILFAALVATICTRHIYDNYLSKNLRSMEWTKQRKAAEITYYDRRCDPSDMSTRDVADLLIQPNHTRDDCVHHMMVHGASVYPDLLSAETAIQLRQFVLRRNAELTDKDAITVLENKQRWSFGIGANEDPSVAKALQEIATHPQLAPALEGIAGHDPAVIEMTAITSAYGAKAQFWHTDTVASMGNDLKHSRSFVTSYSLFITLQDTTAAMGATETCPGTQVCHEGGADRFCSDLGFQVSGKHGVWKRGYGILQNQHTYHRGPAHRDEHGDHRVLFILTFAPRPAARAESRMIGQGGSYSIRWDMWGFTLNDLGHATTRMAWPWAPLKALGLYRFPGSNWGWDLPAIVSMRIANEDVGYELDELDRFFDNGEPSWLPSLIRTKAADKVSEEGEWEDYLIACVDESRHFLEKVNIITLASFLGLAILLSLFQFASARRKGTKPKMFISSALRRLVLTHGLIALSGYLALRHIANTPWAEDIDRGRQFTSAVGPSSSFFKRQRRKSTSRPTLPRKNDAMFSIRYDGENYGSINRFIDYHPGNLRLDSLIGLFTGSEAGSIRTLPTSMQDHIVQTILGEMKREDRRILAQTGDGGWTVMTPSESYDLVTREVLKANDKRLRTIDAKILLMISKARYGVLRSTTMAQKFTVVQLEQLRKKLISLQGMGRSSPLSNQATSSKVTQFRTAIVAKLADGKPRPRPRRDRVGNISLSCICDPNRCSPMDIDFLPTVGDVVEAQYEGKFNEYYKAKVIRVNNPFKGGYDVEYFDGDIDRGLAPRYVRRYFPPHTREVFEAKVPDENEWELCAVTKIHDGEKYDVQFEDGKKGYSLPVTDIRRVVWEYEAGDDVFVEKKGGRIRVGVVTKELGDGTYDIRYDDGEEVYGVPQDLIHLLWDLDER